jgi:hypothetical protein
MHSMHAVAAAVAICKTCTQCTLTQRLAVRRRYGVTKRCCVFSLLLCLLLFTRQMSCASPRQMIGTWIDTKYEQVLTQIDNTSHRCHVHAVQSRCEPITQA